MSGELLSCCKFTLLEQICPKRFDDVSLRSAGAHQACPVRDPLLPSGSLRLSHLHHSGLGSPCLAARHLWFSVQGEATGNSGFPN